MNWIRYGYMIGVNSIERAYCQSIKAFEAERDGSEASWRQLREEADFDADDDETRQCAGHLGDIAFEAEQSIQAVREAFALVLYHYWEQQACFHLNMKHYKQDDIFAKVSASFKVDKVGIDRLRLIANVLKHGNDALFKREPGLFDKSLIPQKPETESEIGAELGPEPFHYRYAFRLTAEELDAAFFAVKSSGPSGEYPADEEDDTAPS